MGANWIKWILESRNQSLKPFLSLTPKLFFGAHHLDRLLPSFQKRKVPWLGTDWSSFHAFESLRIKNDIFYMMQLSIQTVHIWSCAKEFKMPKIKKVWQYPSVRHLSPFSNDIFYLIALCDSSLMQNMLTVQDLGRNQDYSPFQPLCCLREWCTETSTM